MRYDWPLNLFMSVITIKSRLVTMIWIQFRLIKGEFSLRIQKSCITSFKTLSSRVYRNDSLLPIMNECYKIYIYIASLEERYSRATTKIRITIERQYLKWIEKESFKNSNVFNSLNCMLYICHECLFVAM